MFSILIPFENVTLPESWKLSLENEFGVRENWIMSSSPMEAVVRHDLIRNYGAVKPDRTVSHGYGLWSLTIHRVTRNIYSL